MFWVQQKINSASAGTALGMSECKFALSHCEANSVGREMMPSFKEELCVAVVVADAHKLTTKLTSALQPSALHRALMALVHTHTHAHAHSTLKSPSLHNICNVPVVSLMQRDGTLIKTF